MKEGSETQTNKHDPTPVIIRGDTGPLNRDMQLVQRKISIGQHNNI